MGPLWLPGCGKSATDVSLHKATDKGPVSCAIPWLGSPQLHQRGDTSNLLVKMDAATTSFSGTVLLVRASADYLSRAKISLFFLINRERAPGARSW